MAQIAITHSTNTYTEYSISFHGRSIKTTVTADPEAQKNWLYSLPLSYQDTTELVRKVIGIDVQPEPFPHFVVCVDDKCLIYKVPRLSAQGVPSILKFFVDRHVMAHIGLDLTTDLTVLGTEYSWGRQQGTITDLVDLIRPHCHGVPRMDNTSMGLKVPRTALGSPERNRFQNVVLRTYAYGFLDQSRTMTMPSINPPTDEPDVVMRSSVIAFLIMTLGRLFYRKGMNREILSQLILGRKF